MKTTGHKPRPPVPPEPPDPPIPPIPPPPVPGGTFRERWERSVMDTGTLFRLMVLEAIANEPEDADLRLSMFTGERHTVTIGGALARDLRHLLREFLRRRP